jgi:flavodoxin
MNSAIICYSVSGHTKAVAEAIQKYTGADTKEIELVKPYSFVGSITRGLVDT